MMMMVMMMMMIIIIIIIIIISVKFWTPCCVLFCCKGDLKLLKCLPRVVTPAVLCCMSDGAWVRAQCNNPVILVGIPAYCYHVTN